MIRKIALPGLLLAALSVAGAGAALGADPEPGLPLSRGNILEPARHVEAFRNMDRVFPYHVIHRGGPVAEIPRAERALEVSYDWNGGRHMLDDLLARTRTQGLLVIKNGHIVSERYFNGADGNTRFTSWSVAKSFTSTLVGLAIADRKIAGVDAPITRYLPELKRSGYNGVTIKDILEMSSGVDFTEEYTNPKSDVEIMWRRTMVDESERFDDFARGLGRKEKPGRRFYYRSVDTGVLGLLVRRVTGKPLADYLSERIWQPLGTESDATWLTDRPGPDGMEAAFCCINATLRDYGRFALLFLGNGKWNGRQILPTAWIGQATRSHDPQVQPGHLMPGYWLGYGYQWWTFPGPARAFTGQGIYFQFLYVNPRDNLVIVKTSAFDTDWDDELESETYAAFGAIAAALRGG